MIERRHLGRWMLTLLAVAAWAFALLSLGSFSPTDWPSHAVYPWGPTQNLCGPAGAFFAYHLLTYLGVGVFGLLAFIGLFLGFKIWGQRVGDTWLRAIGLGMLVVSLGAVFHLLVPGRAGGLPEGSGGIVGMAAGTYLKVHFGPTGAGLMLVAAMLLGVVLAADELVIRFPVFVGGSYRKVRDAVPRIQMTFPQIPKLPSLPKFVTRDVYSPAASNSEKLVAASSVKQRPTRLKKVDDEDELEKPPVLLSRAQRLRELADEVERETNRADESATLDEFDDVGDLIVAAPRAARSPVSSKAKSPVVAPPDPIPAEREPEPGVEPKRDIVVRLPSMLKPRRIAPAPPKELGDYTMPDWDCLAEAEHGYAETQEKFVREKAAVLEQALTEYGVDAHVTEIDTGPVITMYEISLAPGIRVSAITALSNDIARALSAVSVRVVAPIPGKNTVGIEVPNEQKEKVRLKELMQLAPDAISKMSIPLFLGKDASGEPLITDLAAMPHCLIAGTTGSGKSVCINTVIMSIMYTQRPDLVKLILVDPKVVEMAPFKDIPHLMCPVIHETAKALSVLEWATTKMDERYDLLAEAGTRNIASYNKLTKEDLAERFGPASPDEEAQIPKKLPYIVIIIDELADLMMTSGKEVESHIVRIAQKARAVGIHLVLATQRPQATVVTGLIKANMPSKIAFRVASRMDSRIVLDQNGADLLLGQGDMLFLPPGASKPMRSQGTYIDDKEIRESVKKVKILAEQQFEPELVQIRSANADVDDEATKDPLFEDAVRVVLETRRGSVSLLQRRLTIGYARASRLIEAMAALGLVGDYKGSQAREATITIDEWEAMKAAELERANAESESDEDEKETTNSAA